LSEALEEMLFYLLRNSGAGVAHFQEDSICPILGVDTDDPSFRRITQSIGDQVGESPGKFHRIAMDLGRRCADAGRERNLLLISLQSKCI
jgi:hypothetical protein